MNKIFGISGILFLVFAFSESKAQVHVDINIGRPPVYVAPIPEHRVNYYYLPDEDVYYHVVQKRYYYQHRGRWVSAARYRDCDPHRSRRVAVYESAPYRRHDYYRSKYKSGKKYHSNNGKGKGHHMRGHR